MFGGFLRLDTAGSFLAVTIAGFSALAAAERPVPIELVEQRTDAIQLAGSLYLPPGEGPFPAVVPVHFGGDDTIVPVEASIAAMRAAFRRSGNEHLTIRVFSGGDHGVFVAAKDGTRRPAPGFYETVGDWLQRFSR